MILGVINLSLIVLAFFILGKSMGIDGVILCVRTLQRRNHKNENVR